ncbi:proline-rich receptor-like protein kinase PERK9 [Iris pallida]|uniref:Proline-rich receptor-like protein kinase PERK9 n=1 Tax=Iris pallida TaxID=29817 RepID=A0AAX6DQF1_IRIPA|nr:proline-rich receptor-like protein kinase PERK9 [Iris pallida]
MEVGHDGSALREVFGSGATSQVMVLLPLYSLSECLVWMAVVVVVVPIVVAGRWMCSEMGRCVAMV